jgi:hypothetical protein
VIAYPAIAIAIAIAVLVVTGENVKAGFEPVIEPCVISTVSCRA